MQDRREKAKADKLQSLRAQRLSKLFVILEIYVTRRYFLAYCTLIIYLFVHKWRTGDVKYLIYDFGAVLSGYFETHYAAKIVLFVSLAGRLRVFLEID